MNKIVLCVCSMFIGILCLTPEVMANEGSNWRSTYDLIMMWINFGILAFVLIKFGKTPIMNFLRGQRDTLAREIDQLEHEKKEIFTKVKQTFKELEKSEARFSEMKTRIIEQGENRKTEIIEDAKKQSVIMMEIAKQKTEGHIMRAKELFKAELIDTAVEMATERLPQIVTPDDEQKLVDGYIAALK